MSDELCENINTLLWKCVNPPYSSDVDTILKDFIIVNCDELSNDEVWEEIREQINAFINYQNLTHRRKPSYTPLNDNIGHIQFLYDLYIAGNKSFNVEI